MSKIKILIAASVIASCLSGCGYSTRSLLPSDIKSIYVDNIKNGIDLTQEVDDRRDYRAYRPNLEIEITKRIKDRFMLDGTLRLVNGPRQADLTTNGILTDFKKEVLRYDSLDNPKEYRIKIVLNIKIENLKTGKTVWQESDMVGETTYRLDGDFAQSEDSALAGAISDIAKRVVERTIEIW